MENGHAIVGSDRQARITMGIVGIIAGFAFWAVVVIVPVIAVIFP
jgi:tetrahydromethanopterin S-methyltransferase subunit F